MSELKLCGVSGLKIAPGTKWVLDLFDSTTPDRIGHNEDTQAGAALQFAAWTAEVERIQARLNDNATSKDDWIATFRYRPDAEAQRDLWLEVFKKARN